MKFFCVFSHPSGTQVILNLQGPQYYFPKILNAIKRITEVSIFLILLYVHHIFEFEHFRFPFCTKNSLTWVVKGKELNSIWKKVELLRKTLHE